jgi:hypothetical protein
MLVVQSALSVGMSLVGGELEETSRLAVVFL